MNRGYLILAENSPSGNYLEMAYALAISIKLTQSTVNQVAVAVPEDQEMPEKYKEVFDYIVPIPWGDQNEKGEKWKVKNKWKLPWLSPFSHTVFLDADLLLFSDISHWWSILRRQEMWFSTCPLNYQTLPFEGDYYRQVFRENNLPDIYNCFFYFEKTPAVFAFFDLMKTITWDWENFEFSYLNKKRPQRYSGDVAFALTLKLSGLEGTNSYFDIPRFIHMKTQGQGWQLSKDESKAVQEDWTRYVPNYFTPDLECFVGGYRILEPFHYHVKSFLTPRIIEYYEERLHLLAPVER